MIIDLPRFIEAERPSWSELQAMLLRLGAEEDRRLSVEEARRFHFLYQKVSADLGRIATFTSEPELRGYL
ncbi:MAG: stage II sporulation protein M, partial [Verrucomicrobiaceae bacterium]|nr:stage II sporulation protein M [Verrucomicrobiaceae bacterium]